MRKLFIGIVGLTLALFVTAVVIAQEIENSPPSSSPTPTPSIEYFLPYPGILPDHPLYPIKVFRDRVVGFLISDPVKQIEFNLLMADKRLNMGVFLSERGKEALAQTTISKSEKYLLQAVEDFGAIYGKREGLAVLREKLENATVKHEDVITKLSAKSPESYKAGYGESLTLVQDLHDRITELQ